MRTYLLSLGLLALIAASGCSRDSYAERLLTQDVALGKGSMTLVASGDQLVARKKIGANVVVMAPDRTSIDTWVMLPGTPAASPQTAIVMLHGINETKASFPYFGAAQRLAAMGYTVVLVDLRAHGRSGGKYITYGAMEKQDVKAVVDSLLARKLIPPRVVVFGANIGAAVAIQYAVIDPQRVAGVVAFSPYKDFASFARWQLFFANPLISEQRFATIQEEALNLGHFKNADTSTMDSVALLRCPLLLIAGLLDLSTPLEHTYAIYRNAPEPKKLIVVTPGPEQLALAAMLEDWIAQQVAAVAQGKLDQASKPDTNPATKPAGK